MAKCLRTLCVNPALQANNTVTPFPSSPLLECQSPSHWFTQTSMDPFLSRHFPIAVTGSASLMTTLALPMSSYSRKRVKYWVHSSVTMLEIFPFWQLVDCTREVLNPFICFYFLFISAGEPVLSS